MEEEPVADGDAWSACAFPAVFRRYQAQALQAVDDLRAAGELRAYVALPPGAGKTVLGLEVARRLGRNTLVLTPNTAVQAQWLDAWAGFGPPGQAHPVPGTTDRALPTPLTVLTYQSLSVWDRTADDEQPEPDDTTPATAARRRAAVRGDAGADLLSLLHPNGRAVVERAAATGPWTLVLDECHHLLETWGALCRGLVEALGPDTWVMGLTATPPTEMTARQRRLHDDLFGSCDVAVPTAAVVKAGELAPFQELLYVTAPTDDEDTYLAGDRARFADLQVELVAERSGTLPFAEWLRRRFAERRFEPSSDGADGQQLPWRELEADEPELARAALRLVGSGLVPLPDGAQLREEHRVDADAQDWAVLLAAYCTEHLVPSEDPADARLLSAVRAVLPGLGYSLTMRGLRATTSPVDRVCALSASKAAAAVHVLGVEHEVLGHELRAAVLCDVEVRPTTAPARLADADEPTAGSARTALVALATSDLGPALRPVLVTGRTVAMRREDVAAFRGSPAVQAAGLSHQLVEEPLDGSRAVVRLVAGPAWTPRTWTRLVTAWLVEGGTQVVVGTRSLLGEGWDCPPLNVVVDLSSAATATSVAQVRGRSLRLDPERPDKVADNWTVVCVADGHPRGDADHLRAARKHASHLAPAPSGEVESGIGHCDEAVSPYAPPAPDDRAGVNARALARAADRASAREAWRARPGERGVELSSVQLRAARPFGLAPGVVHPGVLRPASLLGADAEAVTSGAPAPPQLRPSRAWPLPTGGAALATGAGLVASPVAAVAAGVGVGALLTGGLAAQRYRRQADSLRDAPADGDTASVRQFAAAVADALQAAELSPAGASAVRVAGGSGGWLTCTLDGPPAASALFARGLEELLAPLGEPRWLVSRLVLPAPTSPSERRRLAWAAALGRPVEAAVAWHAVPTELGRTTARVALFEAAWERHVGPGRLVRSHEPEGQALLELLRGADPFALTSRLRTVWR